MASEDSNAYVHARQESVVSISKRRTGQTRQPVVARSTLHAEETPEERVRVWFSGAEVFEVEVEAGVALGRGGTIASGKPLSEGAQFIVSVRQRTRGAIATRHGFLLQRRSGVPQRTRLCRLCFSKSLSLLLHLEAVTILVGGDTRDRFRARLCSASLIFLALSDLFLVFAAKLFLLGGAPLFVNRAEPIILHFLPTGLGCLALALGLLSLALPLCVSRLPAADGVHVALGAGQ
jgi:hypothetical protein